MKENGGRVVRLEVDNGRALAKGSSGECLSAVPLSLQPSFAGARRLFPLGNDVFARIRRHRGALRLIVRMRIEESEHMYTNAFIRCQAPAAASSEKNGCLICSMICSYWHA